MASLMWYIYDFARKAWADTFLNAKNEPEISQKPERFRDFPKVNKEYCIGCGACTVSCPSPNAIKLVRDEDTGGGAALHPERGHHPGDGAGGGAADVDAGADRPGAGHRQHAP